MAVARKFQLLMRKAKKPDEQHFAEEGRERRLLRQRPLRAGEHDRNDDQRIQDIGHIALDQAEAGIGDGRETDRGRN
jgi:hypothetical protein